MFFRRTLSLVHDRFVCMLHMNRKCTSHMESRFLQLSFRPVYVVNSSQQLLSRLFIDVGAQTNIHQVGQLLSGIFLANKSRSCYGRMKHRTKIENYKMQTYALWTFQLIEAVSTQGRFKVAVKSGLDTLHS